MSNLLPDKELPLTLRVDRQLSLSAEAATRPSAIAQARPDRPLQGGDETVGRSPGFVGLIDQATAINLGMTGIALVAGFGWFLKRRRRMTSGDAPKAPATATDADADANANANADVKSSKLQFAPVPTRRRSSWFVNVSHRKRLISLMLGMRLVAGAMAILAAIAVVVFWSIESTERGPRDMGLTWDLLVVLFAGWAGYWGFGGLANWLHRATFNRVHPKFDT